MICKMKSHNYIYFLIIAFILGSVLSCTPEDPIISDDPQEVPEDATGPSEDQEDDIIDPGWESAEAAVANFGVGWNLGNTLDTHIDNGHDGSDWKYWETGWGQPVTTPELMLMMKNAGFGAVRVPVTWGIHMDASGKVFDAWMDRVHEVVGYVLDAGMYCILNVHHDTGADESAWLVADPSVYFDQKERYEYLWRQIAEEFMDHDHKLLFESYNEMLDSRRSWCYASFNGAYDDAFARGAYDAINEYAQSFVDVVRDTGGGNIARNLIVNTYGACSGAGTWNAHLKDPLKYMKLPDDLLEDHLLFEVHAYPDIEYFNSMKAEVDDMFAALETHLESKGAPVVIGEWGTSSINPTEDDLVDFASYFVSKAKECGMGTFYWMTLSDGMARSLPAFNKPLLAESIVKAFNGQTTGYVYPSLDDYDYTYSVSYYSQWAEANLTEGPILTSDYSGIALVLGQEPGEGDLAVKMYGETEDKQTYAYFTDSEHTFSIDASRLGSCVDRITLQYMKNGEYSIEIKDVELIRKDGKRKTMPVSSFWGCTIELIPVPESKN